MSATVKLGDSMCFYKWEGGQHRGPMHATVAEVQGSMCTLNVLEPLTGHSFGRVGVTVVPKNSQVPSMDYCALPE